MHPKTNTLDPLIDNNVTQKHTKTIKETKGIFTLEFSSYLSTLNNTVMSRSLPLTPNPESKG